LTGAGLFYAEITGFSRAGSQVFNQLTDIGCPDIASTLCNFDGLAYQPFL